MNSWKEAPHLFANGKFKVEWTHGIGLLVGISGYNNPRLHCEETEGTSNPYASECTLIARKISDMSDEEVRTYSDNWIGYEKEGRSAFIDLSDGVMPTRLFLYLLSIGVYPFDQNHNDIIWRYENTKS